jgi:transposase
MYCGIDVSKNKSQVCILDSNKRVAESFEIAHNKAGFVELEQHLSKDTQIGMEVTSNYCKTLYYYLKDRYSVCYVDNFQMSTFRKLHYSHIKNDVIDAQLIAEYLASDFNKINLERISDLKDLSKLYQKTIKQLTRYKFMFQNQLNIIFPELEKHFCIDSIKAMAQLLIKYPSPIKLANATAEDIFKTLKENKNYLRKIDYAERIKALAANSVGVKGYPTTCFQYTIRLMAFYQELINDLRKQMKQRVLQTPYGRLLDEYGYRINSLSTIVGEVGDIRRFANHKKFVRYCGLDVSEKQSGKSTSKSCYITKRGNSYLRFTFYNLCLVHLCYKTKMSQFFYRLRAAGKHPKKCMVALSRKLAIKCYYDLMKCHQ